MIMFKLCLKSRYFLKEFLFLGVRLVKNKHFDLIEVLKKDIENVFLDLYILYFAIFLSGKNKLSNLFLCVNFSLHPQGNLDS